MATWRVCSPRRGAPRSRRQRAPEKRAGEPSKGGAPSPGGGAGVPGKEGGAAVEPPAGPGEAGGEALEAVVAELGVGGGGVEAALGELGIALHAVLHGLDDAGGDAAGLEGLHELVRLALRGAGRDGGVQDILVGDAGLVRDEPRVGSERGQAKLGAEGLPAGIVLDGDSDPAVVAGAGVDAVGRAGGPAGAVADALGGAAVDLEVEHVDAGEEHAGLDLGEVDVLALAGLGTVVEGHEGRDGAVVASGVVEVGEAPAGGGLVWESGDGGRAGYGLGGGSPGDVAGVAAGVAVAGDGEVDDIGPQLAEALVGEAHALEGAGAEVLDNEVGDADEALDEVASAGVTEVSGDAELVAVEVVVHASAVGTRFAGHEADGVEVVGVLDLNDLGSEVGEDAGGLGARDDPGEIADADALKRQGSRGGFGRRHKDARVARIVRAGEPQGFAPGPSCAYVDVRENVSTEEPRSRWWGTWPDLPTGGARGRVPRGRLGPA